MTDSSQLPDAPVPDAILEAALYVTDLDEAEAFYGGILGLQRIQRAGNRHAFFRVGRSILLLFNPDETEILGQNTKMPVPPHGARGPGHLCFAQSRAEMDRMRARLEAAGHEIESEFDWPNGAHSIYVRDPAGNSVEIAEPRLWF